MRPSHLLPLTQFLIVSIAFALAAGQYLTAVRPDISPRAAAGRGRGRRYVARSRQSDGAHQRVILV
jgi:hypothetical protein